MLIMEVATVACVLQLEVQHCGRCSLFGSMCYFASPLIDINLHSPTTTSATSTTMAP
eukprot:m.168127 g.168127  ORF g.168127 m.168127 type:complete len:57 (+) comp14470_c0_seq2:168-338(+)